MGRSLKTHTFPLPLAPGSPDALRRRANHWQEEPLYGSRARAERREALSSFGDAGMYERFTDRARKVMQLANQEAQRFNHEYIGTEHILLGLSRKARALPPTS